jgi:hypothetical protein
MLRKAVADGAQSGESSFVQTAKSTPTQALQRFEHYELVTGEDGKPIELGRGAMGVTYKAFDVDLHCPVTLKVISERYFGDESARLRFLGEARAAASVRHPNVASVFHLGENRGQLLLRHGVCGVIANVLFEAAVCVVSKNHGVGQIEVFDDGLKLFLVILGDLAAEDGGELIHHLSGGASEITEMEPLFLAGRWCGCHRLGRKRAGADNRNFCVRCL